MAGHSNTGFVHDFDQSSDYNFRMLSFQTDVMNSTSEMNSGIMCSSSGSNNAVGSIPSGSPDKFCNSSTTFDAGTPFGSGHREWVRGLKHVSRLAVDWTYEEQNVLNEGLISSSGSNNAVGRIPSGSPENFGNSSTTFNPGTSFGSGHREWVRGLKNDSRLAVDWTYEEQNVLNEGLIRYAGEGHIMKYIKISALLPNKSARDVALRIRWLVKHEIAKRHKLEEHCAGKRIRERKEKMTHSYLSRNVHNFSPNNSSFSPMTHQASSKKKNSIEVSTWDGSTQQLMDETNQILGRIATNLGLLKLQDNIDLFCHTRNSILSILSSMRSMPGIMGQMPPLPISVDDELLCLIFSNRSQAYMCGSHGDCDLKQEPTSYRESNPL